MNFHETRMGRTFYEHQLPQLIQSLQVIAEKLSTPAPVIRLPAETDKDILTRLYYGNYEPENFIRTERTARQNSRSREAYTALETSLTEPLLTLLRTYSDAMSERESDSAALAYQSGFRAAVQLIMAGLSNSGEMARLKNNYDGQAGEQV